MNPDKLLKRLESSNCNTEETIRRLTGDKEFYIQLLKTFYREKSWEKLFTCTETEDYRQAFEVAHMLKGSILTLGLLPVAGSIVPLVERLRQLSKNPVSDEEYDDAKKDLWDAYDMFSEEILYMSGLFEDD